MIIYSATKSEFRSDVRSNQIDGLILEAYKRNLGQSTSESEINSWKNSMMYMSNVLDDDEIPDNTGLAIEYKIPQTSKRIDFILSGLNEQKESSTVIVELKQWSEVKITNKDGIVKTFIGGAEREVSHPSYQAWTYAALLEDFNEAVQTKAIKLNPCAYLHNMESEEIIKNNHYYDYLRKAPVFIRKDAEKLTEFIKQFIHYGDSRAIIFEIDNSKIRPSKALADKLASMLKGNEEFLMIDDQKLVFETALDLALNSSGKDKNVLIVKGGPGTGKSVVAVNLLVRLTEKRLLTQYVTKNAAPRAVYASVLTNSFKKSHINNLFHGSGDYINCEPNLFDTLIVDEAHRLNKKSGLFQNKGENQIKEIIQASKCSIFFIDEDQQVTWKDIGDVKEIEKWANKIGAKVHIMELESQFRCNGSDGYLAWLDNILQIRRTANETLGEIDFDFRVFNSPNELKDAILIKNKINNKARIVAGYCWDWISKKPESQSESDIVINEYGFAAQWNLKVDGSLWILKPETVNEIGCIHTCQGLELDYVGVIIGPDLIIRDGKLYLQPDQRAKTDQSLKGYKKALRENSDVARAKAEMIIKNTYRTLMSRGQKGCYIFCSDSETNQYFSEQARAAIVANVKDNKVMVLNDHPQKLDDRYPGLNLEILDKGDVIPYENAVPLYDLKIAAGQFSNEQKVNETDCDWVVLPNTFRITKDLFVAQIIGESMNRRIPNGSYCLFKKIPVGSRQGKIVLIEHDEIHDTDFGGNYTLKRYSSEKRYYEDGTWEHECIILHPDSNSEGYSTIVLNHEQSENLKVVAEFVAVL